MRKQFIQNMVVGIFVAAVLVWGAYTIYTTSEEGTMLFGNAITLNSHMTNANGIKFYTSVRVHGIPVGKVESVKFSEEAGEDLIYINMSLSNKYIGMIAIGNPDPKAPVNDPEGIFGYFFISSEGLLGDNLLDIYAGDPTRAADAAKKSVRAWATRNINEAWEAAGKEWDEVDAQPEIEQEYQELIINVPDLNKGYVADGEYLPTKPGGGGLGAITESLDPTLALVNDLLEAAKTEPGLINTLIYNPKGKELVENLNKTVAHVEVILGDARKGPGSLYEILYGDQLKKVLNDLTGVSNSARLALVDVKSVTGSVSDIMADVKKKDLVGNIKGTLVNVEDITKKINEGEGTLGLLITDKSVYEDLQEIMGGAKRSTVIRQAVRYVKGRNKQKPEDTKSSPE